jgi:hypothetical protein
MKQRSMLAGIFCLLSILLANAQGNLISNFSNNFSGLPPAKLAWIQKMQASGKYQTLYVTQPNNLTSILQNGKFKVNAPDELCGEVTFETKNIVYKNADNYTWYGAMVLKDSCNCADGEAMLYRENGKSFGYFHIGSNSYSMEQITETQCIFAKNMPATGHCDSSGADSLFSLPTADRAEGDNCIVRVLILVTEAAQQNLGSNYLSKINMQIARANQVLLNSEIGQSAFQWVIAGVEVVGTDILDENGKSIGQIRQNLQASLPPWTNSSPIIDFEQEYSADVFMVLVNGDLLGYDGTSTSAQTAGRFSVLDEAHINDSYTVEHEMGHLLGAGHESCLGAFTGINCIASPTPPGFAPLPARAHTFYQGCHRERRKRRTIVYSQLDENGQILPYYSNPNINYQGFPLGIAGMADNTSVILNRSCAVANYNIQNPSGIFYVNLSGPSQMCEESTETFNVSISGAPGPYSFSWRVSVDGGINFGPEVSNTASFSYSAPYPFSSPNIVLKVLATKTSNGVTEEGFKTVVVHDRDIPPCTQWRPQGIIGSNLVINASIFPNPVATGEPLLVSLSTNEDKMVRCVLTNRFGKIVAERNSAIKSSAAEPTILTLPTENALPGLYYLTLFSDALPVEIQKVIILN